MKRRALPAAMIALAGIVLVTAAYLVLRSQNDADELALAMVTVRLDRQNDIYYQLAQRVEACASADETTVSDGELRAFCEGVNCLVRDELLSGLLERARIPEDTAELLRELMGTTAKYALEELQPSELPEEALEELAECLYQLADCCDRGQEGSLAYCVSVQDFESDVYRETEVQVTALMTELDGLLA